MQATEKKSFNPETGARLSVSSGMPMATNGTLCESLLAAAETDKGITFIRGSAEIRMDYRQLLEAALAAAEGMRKQGVGPGDEIVLQLAEPEAFLPWFWACLMGGFVAVPIEVRRTPDHVAKVFRVWEKLERKWLVADEESMAGLSGYAEKFLLQGSLGEMTRRRVHPAPVGGASTPHPIRVHTAESRAFIQFSSGTTGDPKGVVLSHRNIVANIKGIFERVGYSEGERSLSWLPLTHDMGLIGFHLAPLVARMDQFLMPPESFIRYPVRWMEKMSEHGIQYTACPNFGMKHFLQRFRSQAKTEMDLSCIRLIFNGAEQISPRLCEDFSSALSPFGLRRSAIYNVYGLAEASVAATLPLPGEELRTVTIDRRRLDIHEPVVFLQKQDPGAMELAEVGMPINGSPVRIHGKGIEPADDGILGAIWIKGENVTEGYYKNSVEVEGSRNPEGWLDTGDVGFLLRNRLFVTGRLKDIICSNGRKFFCHDLEGVAHDLPELAGCRIAAVGVPGNEYDGEQVALFLETKSTDYASLAKTASVLKSQLLSCFSVDAAWVIPISSLPRTTSGKIQRYKLKQEFSNGSFQAKVEALAGEGFRGAVGDGDVPAKAGISFQPLGVSQAGSFRLELLATVAESLRMDSALIDMERSLLELGFNSIMAVNLKNRVENEFGSSIDLSVFLEPRPLREILDIMDRLPRQVPEEGHHRPIEMEL